MWALDGGQCNRFSSRCDCIDGFTGEFCESQEAVPTETPTEAPTEPPTEAIPDEANVIPARNDEIEIDVFNQDENDSLLEDLQTVQNETSAVSTIL